MKLFKILSYPDYRANFKLPALDYYSSMEQDPNKTANSKQDGLDETHLWMSSSFLPYLYNWTS
jgi:hypothetical protein